MWLVVGLGNPGSKYLLTRHNVGFMAVDYLVKSVGVRNDDSKLEHNANTLSFKWENEPVKLVKPETFMNLSGEAVGALARFYKISTDHIIVFQDDMDQPFGQIRLKTKSGDGGHNGIKSLVEHLGTNDILRVKIGVGRSPIAGMDPADWVLQKFSKDEQTALPGILNTAVDAVEAVIFDGAVKAMNVFNQKERN